MQTPHPLLPLIGKVVRCERKAQGFTQAQLGVRAGTSAEYVREVEHGRANPSFTRLDRIARSGLGMPLEDILASVGNVDPRRPDKAI